MRTHAQIVAAAGAVEQVAEDRGVHPNTVRSWVLRDKIPDEHWAAFAASGLATLDELATYAASKRKAA